MAKVFAAIHGENAREDGGLTSDVNKSEMLELQSQQLQKGEQVLPPPHQESVSSQTSLRTTEGTETRIYNSYEMALMNEIKTPDAYIPPKPRGSSKARSTVDLEIQEEMAHFYDAFEGLSDNFKLLDKIGEGTFSSVYKAIDLRHDDYENEWDYYENEHMRKMLRLSSPNEGSPTGSEGSSEGEEFTNMPKESRPKRHLVAIKRIYVTSSPARIANELKILNKLFGCVNIAPLITAMRSNDQVLAILPYFEHSDFRDFFQNGNVLEIQIYFKQLFNALAFVHSKHIIHRDVKPQNFLYNTKHRRGVLVDFGLAEREPDPARLKCVCKDFGIHHREFRHMNGFPKNDTRPGRRSNRAGTRGFRAPEVLLKCPDQSTKIDIWSAGVLLLSFLSKRFPFFNSMDDIEALIEIATIFGRKKMEACALLHGSVFETTIPTIKDAPYQFETLIEWCLTGYRPRRSSSTQGQTSYRRGLSKRPVRVIGNRETVLTDDELRAIDFLKLLLNLNAHSRISAVQALKHPFLDEVFVDVPLFTDSLDKEMTNTEPFDTNWYEEAQQH